MMRLICLAIALYWLAPAGAASAHESRPAFAELTETQPGRFRIVFKRPARGDNVLSLSLTLDPACREAGRPVQYLLSGSAVRQWTVDCGKRGLAGRTLSIPGLQNTLTDALVRISYARGGRESAILRPASPSMVVKGPAGPLDIAWDYTVLGIEHILEGIDHLLFVLCLIFLVRGTGPLVKTVTAFTVAHSITLGAAALGFVSVPTRPVEALIALSIVLLAAAVAGGVRKRSALALRRPWLIAFAFGLLHGFGFAGALSDVGLPQTDIPLALLAFNVGVELGQLLFIAAVLALIAILRFVTAQDVRWGARWAAARLVLVYGIGGVACLWTIQRVAGIFA